MTSWTIAHQASLTMWFPRQQYWSGLSFPSLGNLPDPRYVRGVCNFLGSVSLQQRFEMGDQCYSSVTIQTLFKKQRIVHTSGVRGANPKGEALIPLGFFLYILSPPSWACPTQIGLTWKAVCFTQDSHSSLWIYFCSIFAGFSLLCLFGLPFPILTT